MTTNNAFGGELRRRRVAAQLSLSELAKRLNYSKGYLSKIETGQQPANDQLARLADAELGADGELAALVQPVLAKPDPTANQPIQSNRRQILNFGIALSLPFGVSAADAEAASEDESTENYYRGQFDQIRQRGQLIAPGLALRTVAVDYCTLAELAQAARDPAARTRLGILAARYAEYAGWMAQESGDLPAALLWTREAAKIAGAAGDQTLALYTLVREAELAMYRRDAETTVALARQVQRDPQVEPRVRGLAAHREAQGHAMSNNLRACRVALDKAESLVAAAPAGPGGPALGSTTVADLHMAVTGWCTFDLGRPKQAAELLEQVLARTSPTARRARAMYGARLALAYEAAGDLDRMCDVALQVIATAEPIGSATTRIELRRLTRAVSRRHSYRPAKALQVEINAALIQGN